MEKRLGLLLWKVREDNDIKVKEDRASLTGKFVIPSDSSLTGLLINFLEFLEVVTCRST